MRTVSRWIDGGQASELASSVSPVAHGTRDERTNASHAIPSKQGNVAEIFTRLNGQIAHQRVDAIHERIAQRLNLLR